MKLEWFGKLISFVVLLLIQALVLNHVHLFNCATPLLYVYFVLTFRRNAPHWGILLWSFLMGLCIDMFSNTPGVAAASMTFIGFLQPYVLSLFLQRDSTDDLKPSMRSLGLGKYLYYSFILVLVYCTLFFTLETFNFFNWQQWLLSIGGSGALTLVLVLVIENLRRS